MTDQYNPECLHFFVWIDEGAFQCQRCGVEKVRLKKYGPLYIIDGDGNLWDWQKNRLPPETWSLYD
jgi:hypothetical protein